MRILIAIVSLAVVAGCSAQPTKVSTPVITLSETCIAGFVETSNGVGTLDLYAPCSNCEDVQTIPDVSTDIIPELDLEPC